MMRVFPSQPRLAAGFRFQLAKHNHMVTLFNWALRPLIALDAPVGDVVNELHDFRDIIVQFLATLDGEIDKVKIRSHSAEKPCVPNKAVNLLHVVNSLRTGSNANTAISSNQIACHGCFHG